MLTLLLIVSCSFIHKPVTITTIDSNNFYNVFDSNTYRVLNNNLCFDSMYISNQRYYIASTLKATNLDSSNMSDLSFKLFITYPNSIETITMNSKDSSITIVHHKYCISNYDILETLVMNGAILMIK